ncbi:MAG TPA: biotin/lipoyl-containing protein [Thermoanaerobaculia bacterium]|nr:biotin/lipoyl-containing protein [Thermoanaerobaculia bacterium]
MKLSTGQTRADVVLDGEVARIDGREVRFRERRSGGELTAIEISGEAVAVRVAREGERIFVWCARQAREFRAAPGSSGPPRAGGIGPGRSDSSGGLIAPMPGRVRRILVAEGDAVTRGQVLLILEAMKMEHAIRAARDGRVVRLAFREGDLVEAGVVLAEVE